MRTKRSVAVSLSVLLVLVGLGSTFAPTPAMAKDKAAVVRFECDVISSNIGPADSSVGTPAASASTCAQTIANFLGKGFQQASAEETFNGYFSFGETYTMISTDQNHHDFDVLRLVCQGTSLVFQDGSAHAPAITSTTCSQALADALNARFTFSSGEGIFAGTVTGYTLVRQHE
jgi:hypothetical protein